MDEDMLFSFLTIHTYIFRNYLQDALLDNLGIGFLLEFINNLQYKYTLGTLLPLPFCQTVKHYG